jgi:hypothetical protein
MHLLSTLADRSAARRRHAPAAACSARRKRQGLGLWPWAWLLALVFLAQSLGQVHSVLHTAAPRGDITAQELIGGNAHAQDANHWLGRLFEGHDNTSDCRLYDQVNHGDCMPTAALLHAQALPTAALTAATPESAWARPTLRVHARGPPLPA